jgi:hypothetical protein
MAIQIPKSILDDILEKDTLLNARLVQVELTKYHTQAQHTIANMQAEKANILQQLAPGGMKFYQTQEALSQCQEQLQLSCEQCNRKKEQGTLNIQCKHAEM